MKLSLKNISKSFGEAKVLSNFSYTFPDNSIVCLTGASGCGKTTLLRIISGLEKQDSGEVIKNGSLSYMFQEDRLFSWLNVGENISCVLKKNEKNKVNSILSAVGLVGLENERIGNLSGGMKRRVAFARAISVSPDILLLDEPFTGLDKDIRFILGKHVRKISENCLIIMVTHDPDDVKTLADSVIEL